MKVLVDYLLPYLNFADYDANHATNTQQAVYLEAFVAIIDSIRNDILRFVIVLCLLNKRNIFFNLQYILADND
jgi:hypothetical protein